MCKEICHRKYNQKATIVTNYAEIAIDKNCNGWVVINRSDVAITVNDIPLAGRPAVGQAGESYGMAGNNDEIYVGRITISFNSVPTFAQVVVIQKYFTD